MAKIVSSSRVILGVTIKRFDVMPWGLIRKSLNLLFIKSCSLTIQEVQLCISYHTSGTLAEESGIEGRGTNVQVKEGNWGTEFNSMAAISFQNPLHFSTIGIRAEDMPNGPLIYFFPPFVGP